MKKTILLIFICKLFTNSIIINCSLVKHELEIFQAIESSDLRLLKKTFVDANIDINFKNIFGETPLMRACFIGSLEIFNFLMSQNANIFVTNMHKDNVLMYAIKSHHCSFEICDILIRSGIDVAAVNDFNKTALMIAICQKNIRICRLLLENGANINIDIFNDSGQNALMCSVIFAGIDIFKLILEYCPNINIISFEDRKTVLMHSAINGCKEICKILIEMGAIIDACNIFGNTALIYASKYNYLEICKLLISSGANIHLTNQDGNTALHIAAQRGHQDICYLLIFN